jgi:hypothetical protein
MLVTVRTSLRFSLSISNQIRQIFADKKVRTVRYKEIRRKHTFAILDRVIENFPNLLIILQKFYQFPCKVHTTFQIPLKIHANIPNFLDNFTYRVRIRPYKTRRTNHFRVFPEFRILWFLTGTDLRFRYRWLTRKCAES